MKRSFILIMALAVILVAQQVTLPAEPQPTEPVTPTQPVIPEVPITPITIPDEFHVVNPVENGEVDWSDQVITANGMSVIDTVNFPNRAQAYAMAVRGATVDAQRNLLEIVKGVRVVSETRVVDMMTESDYIYTRVDGVVKGAKPVGEPYEHNGLVEVTLQMSIYDSAGLAPLLYGGLEFPAPVDVEDVPDEVTQALMGTGGIVIDASEAETEPRIFPRFVDEDGNVIFDPGSYYLPSDPRWAQMLRYVQSKGPAVLKSLGVSEDAWIIKVLGTKDGDLVIGEENKKKLQWLQDGLKIFLKLGKVVLMAI